jgi:hypothetical protein
MKGYSSLTSCHLLILSRLSTSPVWAQLMLTVPAWGTRSLYLQNGAPLHRVHAHSLTGVHAVTVKSGDRKLKKHTAAAKKSVAATIAQNPLKVNGSAPAPTRHFFARICGPGSLLPILKINRFFSRTARSRTPPFPLRKHHCALANCSFASLFAAPKLAGFRHLGCIAAQGQRYCSPKNGHSEAYRLAGVGCQN